MMTNMTVPAGEHQYYVYHVTCAMTGLRNDLLCVDGGDRTLNSLSLTTHSLIT